MTPDRSNSSPTSLASCTWVQAYRGGMTDQNTADPDWVPQACTLPSAEQPLRLAEFDALFTASVRGGERVAPRHLRVTLASGGDLTESVRDLAERETQCCSFFTLTVGSPAPGVVQLDMQVPAGHVDVLDALEARATLARGKP